MRNSVPFSLCDASVDGKILKVSSIDANNVVPGQTGSFKVTGTALADVTVKQVNFTLSPGLPLPLPPVAVNKSFKAGEAVEINMDQPIPSFLPAGTYHVNVESVDDNNNHVDCVQFDFTIQAGELEKRFLASSQKKMVNLTANVDYTLCDPSVDGKKLKVNSIDAVNLVPGQTATVTVNATALEDLTVAKVRMELKPGLPLPLPDVDVNKSAKTGETVTITMDHAIPSFVPHGNYSVESTSFDVNGGHIDCVAFSVTL